MANNWTFGDYKFSRKNQVQTLISWSFGWVSQLNETKDVEFLPQVVHECIVSKSRCRENNFPNNDKPCHLCEIFQWRFQLSSLFGEARKKTKQNTHYRWWLQRCFMSIPNLGKDEPILEHIFQMGWNHQPDTSHEWSMSNRCEISKKHKHVYYESLGQFSIVNLSLGRCGLFKREFSGLYTKYFLRYLCMFIRSFVDPCDPEAAQKEQSKISQEDKLW